MFTSTAVVASDPTWARFAVRRVGRLAFQGLRQHQSQDELPGRMVGGAEPCPKFSHRLDGGMELTAAI